MLISSLIQLHSSKIFFTCPLRLNYLMGHWKSLLLDSLFFFFSFSSYVFSFISLYFSSLFVYLFIFLFLFIYLFSIYLFSISPLFFFPSLKVSFNMFIMHSIAVMLPQLSRQSVRLLTVRSWVRAPRGAFLFC